MDGGNEITVRLDADLFECPICREVLSSTIFQCSVGHAICSSCHTKLPKKCALCSLPTVYTRAITMEKIVESAAVKCPNTEYGCRQYLSFSELQQHEHTCIYSPCLFPKQGCSFKGCKKDLKNHLSEHYSGSVHEIKHNAQLSFMLYSTESLKILLEEANSLFLIIRKDTALGWAVSVVCIRPFRSTKPEFWYKLSLKYDGEFPLHLETRAESTTLLNGFPRDKHFLLIPSELCSSGCVEMRVCIAERS